MYKICLCLMLFFIHPIPSQASDSFDCDAHDISTQTAYLGAKKFKLIIVNKKFIQLNSLQPIDSWSWEITNVDRNGNWEATRVSESRSSAFPLVGMPAVWNNEAKKLITLNVRFGKSFNSYIEKWEFNCK